MCKRLIFSGFIMVFIRRFTFAKVQYTVISLFPFASSFLGYQPNLLRNNHDVPSSLPLVTFIYPETPHCVLYVPLDQYA